MSDFLTGYAAFHWIATWSHPVLDVFFRIITDLGSPFAYFVVIAPLFWVGDRRRVLVLFLLLLFSGLVNAEAKLFADTPRPDPSVVRVLDLRPLQSGSRSFPSGHAQIALVFWGYLAYWARRRWFTVMALVLVALISFSRLYLAAHFPIDVLGGLVIGAATLAAIPALDRWAAADFRSPLWAQLLAAGVAVLSMLYASDAGVVTISGCGLALVALQALPQARIPLASRWQMTAVVAAGVALQGISYVFFGPLSDGQVNAGTGFRVTVLWLIALWAYPHAVEAALARRQAVTAST